MDESGLTLGTIDVSYLPHSSEYSLSRCKHMSEEWVSLREELKTFN
jgi:glycerol-3-phosphate O-acyltransferase 1/2